MRFLRGGQHVHELLVPIAGVIVPKLGLVLLKAVLRKAERDAPKEDFAERSISTSSASLASRFCRQAQKD